MKRLIIRIVLTIIVIVSAVELLGCNRTGGSQSSLERQIQVNEEVVAALQEIVAIWERERELIQTKYDTGLDNSGELEDAQNRLSEARIRLATAQHRPGKIVDELRRLLAVYEKKLERIQAKAEIGQASSMNVAAAKIDVLEMRIRLAKAKEVVSPDDIGNPKSR